MYEDRDGIVGIENVITGIGDDTLKGDVEYNVLIGGAGDDEFIWTAGNDRYDGGEGVDTLSILTGGEGTLSLTADHVIDGIEVINLVGSTYTGFRLSKGFHNRYGPDDVIRFDIIAEGSVTLTGWKVDMSIPFTSDGFVTYVLARVKI